MAYLGSTQAQGHGQPGKTVLLLVNLGTPAAPTATALRPYLAEFLADPRVVELPRWLWRLILHGVILRLRPRRSAHAYQRIWTEQGSPLLVQSRELAAALGERLAGQPVEVHLAMSYGQPNLREVLEDLRQQGLRRLLVLPLYPQYSGSTSAAVFDAVAAILKRWRWLPELRFIADYHREPGYVEALAASVRAHWAAHGRGERLLLSFHGVPRRYLLAGDPYYCQCQVTARQLGEALGLEGDAIALSFQSRVGREPWLQPYTDRLLLDWARQGVRRVQVLCPGFAVDCLETLEEIAMQNAEAFRAAGGESLEYLPALNAGSDHVTLLDGLARRHLAGWPGFGSEDPAGAECPQRAQRAAAVRARQAWIDGR